MTPAQIDRVFGRGRLQMATGEHVEVFREAVGPGERRRYTKRFLNTRDGNFAHWTEREWRILARLIGHGVDCVPDVVQFDRGSIAGTQLVQTYDAGATVDQWATLLPLMRESRIYRHAFEDCAHWWALAHHSLVALKKIHQLELVHLDVKGDNVCIPIGPAHLDPDAPSVHLHPVFDQLALIDFAFALVSGEALACPLPIGWQRDYDYQSPRLLKALEEGRNGDLRLTRELDWRCDMYSLAAMLKRYLPDEATVHRTAETGWTAERYDAAKALILSLREHHDRDAVHGLPHAGLINTTLARLRERDLAASLAAGWTLARDADVLPSAAAPLTPITRLAPSIRVFVSPRARSSEPRASVDVADLAAPLIVPPREVPIHRIAHRSISRRTWAGVSVLIVAVGALAAAILYPEFPQAARERVLDWIDTLQPRTTTAAAPTAVPPIAEPPRPASQPVAPSPPVAEAPLPRVADPTPPRVAEAPPPSLAPPPPIARTSPPPSKNASASNKKSRNGAQTSIAQAPSAKIPAGTATARASSTAPKVGASTAKATPAVPIAIAPSPSRAPLVARFDAPTTAIPAQSPKTSNSATTTSPAATSATTTASPTALPDTTTEPIHQDDSTRVDEMPMPPPPVPPRERSRKSLGEKIADQGWLSQLLKLVKAKPAPIEDRRAQGSPPKRVVTESVEPPPSAPPPRAQPEPARPATQTVAAADLTERAAPANVATPPPSPPDPLPTTTLGDGDSVFANEGRRVLRDVVPRVASQAQAEIARVLWVAANANDRSEDRTIVEAVQSIRVADGATSVSPRIAPAEARRLNAEASDAYWSGRNTAETLELQLKAFGANPYDAEVVGNLAVLHLKSSRAQAETARQLAMIAIAYRSGRYRSGRVEDWTTYAIASALTGRMADARNALFVSAALSPNVERSCKSALTALSNYGERMREPVEAMFYRMQVQGRAYESSYCSLSRKFAMAPTSRRAFDEKQ